ncbi:hypothetical protein SYNPS1DRAFT_29529 [Syncephalis pseudoplumigaleata]|uniref:Uncharacterized protein n=1 Tax=Syncephalis pseudoplumigaleata TaxID=1712513 RepID=A0A4P9YXH9_9FUNG|nr:hypothetical protein SYNPS1DRAFT_29529 [Syncephalis pseudoplumigaleata]|eukprot:RKP24714.1 hypothetical protein SYNPS1DRAFT_29529 [Syncephalis pseudoplumigaleata]
MSLPDIDPSRYGRRFDAAEVANRAAEMLPSLLSPNVDAQAKHRPHYPLSPAIRPMMLGAVQSRATMEMCYLPQSVYVGIQVESYNAGKEAVLCLCSHDGTYPLDYHEDTIDLTHFKPGPEQMYEKVSHIVQCLAIGRLEPFGPPLAAEIELATRAWFDFDAVPVLLYARPGDVDERASSVVRKLVARISPQFPGSIFRIPVTHRHEVEVDNGDEIFLCSLLDYQRVANPQVFEAVLDMAKIIRGKHMRVSFFNSTPQGGGVALMRHALLRMAKLLGIDMHWYVAKPKPDVFDITKRKFHNILQGVAPPDTRLTEEDRRMWQDWVINNAKRSWSDAKGPIMRSHIIVVDDPQLCALLPYIRRLNPNCKLIYRSHIEIRADMARVVGSPQHEVWHFLRQFIQEADLFVSHPIANFIPDEVPRDKVVLMPACTDKLDGLNKPLLDWSMGYNRLIFNRVCWDQCGTMLYGRRPYIVQVARFDPSKGIPDVIESYSVFRRLVEGKLPDAQLPQLVICGHGSIDDPDATMMFEDAIRRLQRPEYNHILGDVCVARLPPSDQLLNAILRGSRVALQLSHREGFEIKITEALIKVMRAGVPVIAYAAGGIPHQIDHGQTGFLVPVGDCVTVAQHLYQLFTDRKLYSKMSANAEKQVSPDYFTSANLMSWLWLFNELDEGRTPGGEVWVRDLWRKWYYDEYKQQGAKSAGKDSR